jgi:hypothetical protein
VLSALDVYQRSTLSRAGRRILVGRVGERHADLFLATAHFHLREPPEHQAVGAGQRRLSPSGATASRLRREPTPMAFPWAVVHKFGNDQAGGTR